MQDKVRNKLTLPQYENEVSWWVDVDVARAAGTAPLGGGAHSFDVGVWEIATKMQLAGVWGRGALLQ